MRKPEVLRRIRSDVRRCDRSRVSVLSLQTQTNPGQDARLTEEFFEPDANDYDAKMSLLREMMASQSAFLSMIKC